MCQGGESKPRNSSFLCCYGIARFRVDAELPNVIYLESSSPIVILSPQTHPTIRDCRLVSCVTSCQNLVVLRSRRNQDCILKRGSTAHSVTQVDSSISQSLFCSSTRPGLTAILLPPHLHLRLSVLFQPDHPSIHTAIYDPTTASSTLQFPISPYLSVFPASHSVRLLT
jgi:hypothetical protein